MIVALWIVGAWFLIVYCGTWALQIALWLLMVAIRLAVLLFQIVAGLGVLAAFVVMLLVPAWRGPALDGWRRARAAAPA